jgi:hypothetical protein
MGSLLYDPATFDVYDESDLLDLLDPEDANETVAPPAAAVADPVTGQDGNSAKGRRHTTPVTAAAAVTEQA